MGLKLIVQYPSDKQKKLFFALFFKTTMYCINIFKNHQMKNIQNDDLYKPRAGHTNNVV